MCFFFFKQKTAYEMRISDWSSDVCSSDLEVNEAKKVLAHEATALCHGEAAARAAADTARQTFEEGGLSTGLPQVEVPPFEVEAGLPDRASVVHGRSVSARVDRGDSRIIKKKTLHRRYDDIKITT